MVRELCTFLVTTVEVDDIEGSVAIGTSAVQPDIADDGRAMEPLRLSVQAWARVFSVLEAELLNEYAPGGPGDNAV